MKEIEFCYWLQGFFELGGINAITPEQVQIIKNHLNMVKTLKSPIVKNTVENSGTVAEISTLLARC